MSGLMTVDVEKAHDRRGRLRLALDFFQMSASSVHLPHFTANLKKYATRGASSRAAWMRWLPSCGCCRPRAAG